MESLEKYHDTADVDNILCESKNGKFVTGYEIESCVNEYLEKTYNSELIFQNKPMIFNGLLEYIYSKCIKTVIEDTDTQSYDYKLLNDIFINIYIQLCYKFGYIPNIGIFISHLVHKDMTYIYSIRHGINNNGDKVNNNIISYLKIWDNLCDADLFAHIMQTNSVGGIFTAKVRGYSDQPNNAPMIQVNNYASIDAAQLDLLAESNDPPAQLPKL
jgi:hypothetical protein